MKFPALFLLAALAFTAAAADRVERIRYADFSNWYARDIAESKVIGGKHKTVYEIAPAGKTSGNKPYSNLGGSPWATSNVYARVSGITKASNSVSPAKRGSNTCLLYTSRCV